MHLSLTLKYILQTLPTKVKWILYWRGFSCVTIYFSNHFSSLLKTKRKEKTSKPTNCQYLTVTKSHKTYKLSTSDSYKTTQNLQTVNIWQLQNHTKPTNCQHLTVTKSHKTYKLSTSDSYKITQNLQTVNIWQLQNHTKPTNCQPLTVTKSHKT